MVHSGQSRIVTCMKFVHFCACNDIALEKYPALCMLHRELGTPNILASDEYGSYTNPISGREFLMATRDVIRHSLYAKIYENRFFF